MAALKNIIPITLKSQMHSNFEIHMRYIIISFIQLSCLLIFVQKFGGSFKNGVIDEYKSEAERGFENSSGPAGWTYVFNTIGADVSIILLNDFFKPNPIKITSAGIGSRFSCSTGTGQPDETGLTARNRHIFRFNVKNSKRKTVLSGSPFPV